MVEYETISADGTFQSQVLRVQSFDGEALLTVDPDGTFQVKSKTSALCIDADHVEIAGENGGIRIDATGVHILSAADVKVDGPAGQG